MGWLDLPPDSSVGLEVSWQASPAMRQRMSVALMRQPKATAKTHVDGLVRFDLPPDTSVGLEVSWPASPAMRQHVSGPNEATQGHSEDACR